MVVGITIAGTSRVTIVAPNKHVDLALPSDVPLADVLPTLLKFAGERLADEPAGRHGWTLGRLGGPALDIGRTPVQLEIRDGEFLYLRPRGADPPEPVFDDVVDAIATATRGRAGRWLPATTRRFGLTLGVLALIAGAVAIALAGPPHVVGAVVALGLAGALVAGAAVAARAFGEHRIGLIFALISMCYAAVGGLILFAFDRPSTSLGATELLVAAAAIVLVAALGSIAVAAYGQIFVAVSVAALALGLAAVLCLTWQTTPAGAGAVVLALVLLVVPAMPMLSYRLAGLPVPTLPAGPEDLRTDTESVDGRRVLLLAERADDLLAGMLGAVGLIAAGTAVALVSTGGLPGFILCAVLALLLLSRARWFIATAQRLPLLGAGVVGLAAVGIAGFVASSLVGRLSMVLTGLLLLAAISIGYAILGAGRRISPIWGRTLDILEILLILGVLPLVVWVSGLYSWIRSVREQ